MVFNFFVVWLNVLECFVNLSGVVMFLSVVMVGIK